MAAATIDDAGPPTPHLRRWVLPVGIALAGCVILGVVLLPTLLRQLSWPSITSSSGQEPSQAPAVLPDAYRAPDLTYGPPKKVEAPPPAPAPTPVTAPVAAAGATAPAPPSALLQPPTIPTAVLQPQPKMAPQPPVPALPAVTPPVASMPLPTLPKTSSEARAPGEKSRWGIDLTHGQQQRRERSDKEQQEDKRRDSAQNLLKHAIWATPAVPTKTLYRQQAIPGVTIDEMISDIPGQYKIRVSVPVFDRFRREVELIPKDSVIILTQKRVPGYGEKRLELVVEEIQPPTPEVISLKATVGDKEGAAGVGGNVDNHIPQLVLATLISTAVNIGGRVLAGNPQGYQYSVGQEITRDVGQQVSQDTKSIVDRTLRIPPTITVPAQTPVSVSLQENVMFSRAPLVVR